MGVKTTALAGLTHRFCVRGPITGPVGPCGITSPSDLTSIGPVGPITGHVRPVGPYVARMGGVPTCGSGSTVVGWSGEAGQCDCL